MVDAQEAVGFLIFIVTVAWPLCGWQRLCHLCQTPSALHPSWVIHGWTKEHRPWSLAAWVHTLPHHPDSVPRFPHHQNGESGNAWAHWLVRIKWENAGEHFVPRLTSWGHGSLFVLIPGWIPPRRSPGALCLRAVCTGGSWHWWLCTEGRWELLVPVSCGTIYKRAWHF